MTHDPAVHQRARVSLPAQVPVHACIIGHVVILLLFYGAPFKKIQSQTAGVRLTRLHCSLHPPAVVTAPAKNFT